MTDTILIRSRDFSADTIREHSAFLEQGPRYVWWGWWKKEEEPDRCLILEEIREKLKLGELTVRLFDRSTRRYFTAQMTDCLFVRNAVMYTPDRDTTPAYYHNEKVAAWFRLTSIASLTQDQFATVFHTMPLGDETLFPVSFEADRKDACLQGAQVELCNCEVPRSCTFLICISATTLAIQLRGIGTDI